MATSRTPGPIDLMEFRLDPTGDAYGSRRLERASRFQHHVSSTFDVSRKSGWTVPSRPQFALAFLSSGPPRVGLTREDYRAAATALGTDVDAIEAVARAAANSAAFDAMGRPTMLFESRQFHRHTAGKFDESHPKISNSLAGGPGSPSLHYDKLQEAYDLDPIAALKSAAWGRFHVMGSSYRIAGCTTVNQFVLAIAQSEAAHLMAFVSIVQSNAALRKALRESDWAGFAMHYEG
jgi:hypothetical protein